MTREWGDPDAPTDAFGDEFPDYAVGDLVVDIDQDRDERGTCVVVATPNQRADDYEIEDLGVTVAEVNESHPPEAPVVEVAFAGTLDHNVTEWRAILHHARNHDDGTFADRLETWCDRWDITLRTYSYPATRLGPRRYCPTHKMRAEYDAGIGEDRAGFEVTGYVCPADGCAYADTPVPFPDDPLNADDERPRPGDSWPDTASNADP